MIYVFNISASSYPIIPVLASAVPDVGLEATISCISVCMFEPEKAALCDMASRKIVGFSELVSSIN